MLLFFLVACFGAVVGYRLAHRRLDRDARPSAARSKGGPDTGKSLPGTLAPVGHDAGVRLNAPQAVTLDSRYLFVSFEEEIRRARERGLAVTLLALALEKGADRGAGQGPHDSADRLLRSVAHAVRGQMRGCDTCIRYASSEFILILPGVSRSEAGKVEGRLRVALQGVSHDSGTLRPRVTLGSATFPEEGASFDQLLTLADSRRRRDGAAPRPSAPADQLSAVPFRVPPPTLSRN